MQARATSESGGPGAGGSARAGGSRRAAPRGRFRRAAWWASALALAAAFGCGSMSSIDRQIERAVLRQSDALGGDSPAPRFRRGQAVPESARATEKRPGSVNPGAGELTYRAAPPGRDVLARLDSFAEEPPGAVRLGLEDILRLAQESSREFISAEEEYLLAAIRMLIERHRWGPRLFHELSADLAADQSAGSYRTAMNIINELRASQRLPYGGEVEARLVSRAAWQLSEIAGDRYVQSSSLVLGASVPLLRNAGLIAQEDLIQAERDMVYAARDFETFRRRFLVDIATDYFSLLAQRAVIQNQQRQLISVMWFLEQTRALVEAGREPRFEARNVEQNVLSSRNSLINSRESYILGLDRLKIRLGLPVETPVALAPFSLDLDDPDISVSQAGEMALLFRLELQNETDRVGDAQRAVANARNQLLPDLNATASATLNTDPAAREGGLAFRGDETDYAAGITFGLPLDREIERLSLRQAMIRLQQQARGLDQLRDTILLEARQAVREIDRARFSLELQEQAVQINELRLEEIRIKAGEVDAQTRLDAENELLQSRNDRDAAIRDLRIAILEYLLRTGQLRVRSDGGLRPLEGMEIRLTEVVEDPLPDPDQPPPAPPGVVPPADPGPPADPL